MSQRARPKAPPPAAASVGDQAEYTIDELSARTQVPSRTIRFYQSKGALMPPRIRGRVAIYTPEHVERLKLIAQLQERGLRVNAISGLVRRIERGELDVAEWLGVERQLTTSWSQDQARTVDEDELFELAGRKRPGLINDLLRAKLIERRGEVYVVDSPQLVSIAVKLEAAGMDMETLLTAQDILNKYLGRAVAELSELLLARAREGALALPEQGKLLETLRATGVEVVRILFAKQVERGLRELLSSGALTAVRGEGRRDAARSRLRGRRERS